jgi:hypothetical protein
MGGGGEEGLLEKSGGTSLALFNLFVKKFFIKL